MKKLKRDLKRKLRSNIGESMIETLCAILIAALAIVTLTGMVTTAANANRRVKKIEEAYHTSLYKLNKREVTPVSGTVSVTVPSEAPISYAVNVYTAGDYTMYALPTPTPAGGTP